MLRVSAVFGAAAGASLLAAVYLQLPMPYFYLALSFMGLYRGFSNPPLESIYADSVPTGTRYGVINFPIQPLSWRSCAPCCS